MKPFLVIFAFSFINIIFVDSMVKNDTMTKNCTRWEKGVLGKTIKSLCITQDPDIRLITVDGAMLYTLRKLKELTLFHPEAQRLPYGLPRLSRRKRNRREVPLFQLCQETPGTIFVLVDDEENLVYEIQSIRCEDGCYIGTRFITQIRIGNCVTKKKTIELLVSDGCNGLKPKVIEVGCNCECMKYFLFL